LVVIGGFEPPTPAL